MAFGYRFISSSAKRAHERRDRRASTFKILAASALALSVASLSGCGALVAIHAAHLNAKPEPEREYALVTGGVKKETIAEVADKFALMALFAKVVYRKELIGAERDRHAAVCSYVSPDQPVPDFGMPRRVDPDRAIESGWERWRGTDTAVACKVDRGLAYETYIHRQASGAIDQAVIAFRGTDFNSLQALYDLETNMAAVFGAEPSQYLAVQKLLPGLIKGLLELAPGSKIEIYATGHSLGGGLAQQAGYLSKHIKEVYVFNTSPVTNWSNLVLKQQQQQESRLLQNPDPTIFRIHHLGEGLQSVRTVTTRVNLQRRNRLDYELFFEPMKRIEGHDMSVIACNLARLFTGPEAKHGYTKEFAMKVTDPSYYYSEQRGKGQERPVCPLKED